MRGISRRTAPLVAALVLVLAPMGAPAQAQETSTGTVPWVSSLEEYTAIGLVENAGFVARTRWGSIDCTHSYVQYQSPLGGTTATLGSIVMLTINRQPGPGEECP